MHRVFTNFFFLWVVSTCVFIFLVNLLDGFPSLIFIYRVFFTKGFHSKKRRYQGRC